MQRLQKRKQLGVGEEKERKGVRKAVKEYEGY